MAMAERFDPELQNRISSWLNGPYDEQSKQEIRALMKSNPEELEDAFYTDLAFGTAGLRGLMGPGTNRMNIYTIRKATQGLANYILKQPAYKGGHRVFISYDSRHNSLEYAKEAAQVLAANEIHVYLTKEIRPTPFVSFGCRTMKCIAAIMITASHNPAVYNGYKVYWSDGGQVVPPHDTGIMREVHQISSIEQIKTGPFETDLIERVGEELDQQYIKEIHALQLHPKHNRESGQNLKISYTSLHGTGVTLAPKALCDWGFKNLHFVEEQIVPNGDFPTVKFPNPEYPEALKLGIDHMRKTGADILLANDPDADRLGVVVQHEGHPVILTGNEIASLCVDYICRTRKAKEALTKKDAFITTIVSSDLIPKIAKSYHLHCFEVLTGFKYIAEKIHQWEQTSEGFHYLFGAEESYGFLLGTIVRDKDAIIASCLLAEIALDAKLHGRTLIDQLHALYREHGIYRERQHSIGFEGKEGMESMKAIMKNLRAHPPKTFAGKKVVVLEDYDLAVGYSFPERKEFKLHLTKADVLLFRMEDGSKIVVRPSGTEPKIKIYAGVVLHTFASPEKGIADCEAELIFILNEAEKDILGK